jgi:hypothetical protein
MKKPICSATCLAFLQNKVLVKQARLNPKAFMKIRSLLLAAVFFFMTLSLLAGSLVNQYFPMNNGDSRYYQDHSNPSYKATEFITQTSYNGYSVFSLNFHDEWDGYPFAVLLELPGDFLLAGVRGPERRQRSF